MATSKLWAVKYNLKKVIDYAANPNKTYNPKFSDEQYQALADVLTYAENEEKTEQQFFVQGINCNPSIAREQFVEVKKRFGKTDGIQVCPPRKNRQKTQAKKRMKRMTSMI